MSCQKSETRPKWLSIPPLAPPLTAAASSGLAVPSVFDTPNIVQSQKGVASRPKLPDPAQPSGSFPSHGEGDSTLFPRDINIYDGIDDGSRTSSGIIAGY
ncbi:uncharacterized protein QC761_0026560 [Podospora bellae-mahoneyi]|uniref:Uncharacterized protein n=2 Tax=Podospora TaxID=5144 RepID=A0ABR0FT77_9PEZI|nr:hypothetical protein QC761_0026560 [Podospora bellae-mahoneyi]